MKLFKLKLLNGVNTEEIEVKAEAHTFDGGMILFWSRNNDGEWALLSAYPSAMTAITYYDEYLPPKVTGKSADEMASSITPFIEVSAPLTDPTDKPKKGRGKK